jgi:anti-sigma factor RsiW
MHAVVMESLEDYLSGSLEPIEERAVEAHLATCTACREDLRGMQAVSHLFVSLRSPAASDSTSVDSMAGAAIPEEAWQPSAGFYARVMQEVETRKAAPSFAGLFALDFAFGRRLVLSSLLTLVLVGGWLVSREAGYARGPAPDSVLAQQEAPGFDNASASDNMLATLTSYEQ